MVSAIVRLDVNPVGQLDGHRYWSPMGMSFELPHRCGFYSPDSRGSLVGGGACRTGFSIFKFIMFVLKSEKKTGFVTKLLMKQSVSKSIDNLVTLKRQSITDGNFHR